MKIYNIKRERGRASNRFCGPAAISALTNKDTAETARSLRDRGGLRQITGTSERLLKETLYYDYGIDLYQLSDYSKNCMNRRPTLARWLKQTVKFRTKGRVFVIIAGNHYQIISGRRYVCGMVGEICSIRDKKVRRRARVEKVYEARSV